MHAFNYGDTIFINVSIFQYNIDFIAQSDKFLYANVPLGATCSLICYGVKVDTTQMSVESIAGVSCSRESNATVNIMLSYVTHTLVDAKSFKNSTSSLGRVVLDSLAIDLLIGVLAESTTPTTMINIAEAGAVTCNGFGKINVSITPVQATACTSTSGPVPLFITDIVLTYTNHSLNWIQPRPLTDNLTGLPVTLAESIPNYLCIASAVMLMDMGIWKNNSILTSPALFNVTITPNTPITHLLQQNASVFSMLVESASSASLLLQANPSLFIVPQRKSVLNFIICQHLIGLLPLSRVIVADASMFSAFWGTFMIIASYFACQHWEDTNVQKSLEKQLLSYRDGSDGDR
ncbi:hypothetical protein L208DRAFT_1374175 [Tricholoma matsutake]|nr:hypothetical protein L208DRAFT_1374175 [Tricholoma matsutake 945]